MKHFFFLSLKKGEKGGSSFERKPANLAIRFGGARSVLGVRGNPGRGNAAHASERPPRRVGHDPQGQWQPARPGQLRRPMRPPRAAPAQPPGRLSQKELGAGLGVRVLRRGDKGAGQRRRSTQVLPGRRRFTPTPRVQNGGKRPQREPDSSISAAGRALIAPRQPRPGPTRGAGRGRGARPGAPRPRRARRARAPPPPAPAPRGPRRGERDADRGAHLRRAPAAAPTAATVAEQQQPAAVPRARRRPAARARPAGPPPGRAPRGPAPAPPPPAAGSHWLLGLLNRPRSC